MNDIVKGVIAYKGLDHFVTSADTRRQIKEGRADALAQLDYQQQRDREFLDYRRQYDRQQAEMEQCRMAQERRLAYDQALIAECEAYEQRQHDSAERSADRFAQEQMLKAELKHRSEEQQLALAAWEKDRDAERALQREAMERGEALQRQRLEADRWLEEERAERAYELQRRQERAQMGLEKVKAKTGKELARENSLNRLNEQVAAAALADFPLTVSPAAILGDRDIALQKLSRYKPRQIYVPAKAYGDSPEPVNVILAPSDDKVISSLMARRIEAFLLRHYGKDTDHPVAVYANAWKEGVSAGAHTADALHYFLSDMACLVVEPVVTEQEVGMTMSSWQIARESPSVLRASFSYPLASGTSEGKTSFLLLQLIEINVAIMADIHHLLTCEAEPLVPSLLQEEFPGLYADEEFRMMVYACYERACTALRQGDSLERRMTRQLRLADWKIALGLMQEEQRWDYIVDKLKSYMYVKYDRTAVNEQGLWDFLIANMAAEDVPFYRAILHHVTDRRLYKRLDRRVFEVSRQ